MPRISLGNPDLYTPRNRLGAGEFSPLVVRKEWILIWRQAHVIGKNSGLKGPSCDICTFRTGENLVLVVENDILGRIFHGFFELRTHPPVIAVFLADLPQC